MNEICILKELIKEKRELANSKKNLESIEKWKNVNDLKKSVPPVLIYQIPWHEIQDEKLEIKSQHWFLRYLENQIRQELFVFKNFISDNVLSDYLECPLAYYDSGFGLEEKADKAVVDKNSAIYSHGFHVQIENENDINKLKKADIWVDDKETSQRIEMLQSAFGNLIGINLVGSKGYWFTPWDNLIRLTGVSQTLLNLIDKPEFIHQLLSKFMDLSIDRLHKYVDKGIFSSNNNNTEVGSGGYGYCSKLKQSSESNIFVPTKEIWGCGNAQIFSSVSQNMHYEFSLKYELEWLKNFGLNYYGCCEPLHNKIDILKQIPNLRKISISPWCDISIASQKINKQFVMSIKPSPSVFVGAFDEYTILKQINKILDESDGQYIEIILKDISTINYDVSKIIKWSQIVNTEIKKRF